MYLLRYLVRYLRKGIWVSMIVTGLVFGYAYLKGISVTWFLVQQTNIWLFVVMAGLGLPMSFAHSESDIILETKSQQLLEKSQWSSNSKPIVTDHILPPGGRIVVMSLIPLAVYFITKIWV